MQNQQNMYKKKPSHQTVYNVCSHGVINITIQDQMYQRIDKQQYEACWYEMKIVIETYS